MDKEKLKIAEIFMNRRAFEIEVSKTFISKRAELTKDAGLKQTLLDSSLTTYRAMMYALGTPIESIYQNTMAIREARKSRNGVVEFARHVFSTWDSLVESSQAREIAPMQEVIITESNENPSI